jgi:UDP-N-acetylglucosamine enolpyruvyl transferase
MTETVVASPVTESFVIEGGQPLHGRVTAAGNKNGVLPILAACVMTAEPVVLHNVPRIRDVDTMLALIDDLGADVEWIGANDVRVHAADIRKTELDRELCSQMRASFLLAGPLLVRAGSAIVAPPGGTSSAGAGSTRTSTASRSWASRSRRATRTTCVPTASAAQASSSTRRA